MAELAFVDTHFHLHDMKHPTLRYGWLEPDAVHGFLSDTDPLKAQRYRIKDYLAEIRFANVPKAIHVQAAVNTPDPVDETAWLQAFADETGYPHGIVAECHLALPHAGEVLDRHMKFANLRGIRDFGEGDYYLRDPAWRRGFAELGPRDLVCCLDTSIERAADVLDLAHTFPETVISVDHCAIPGARDADYFCRWRDAIAIMADAPNVIMKVSGLGMRDPLWTVDSIRPYVLGSIEAFGSDRVVFGTNWPVDRMFSSYPDVINAYAEIISGFPRAEQVKMFSGNAERIFRI
ncbi:amidohydrolase family protein [Mesorhizobium yinganensis]|uniref:amidohydrolase family protein n=1 Tax=Mesorhizobium yinganensis TaxID=3157707 RepID=UPI0032B7B2CE